MAEYHVLDGIAIATLMVYSVNLTTDTGVWNPIEYTGNHNGAAVAGTSYSSATGAKLSLQHY